MGVSICNSYIEPSDIGQFEPIMSTFNPITSNIKMAPAHQALFERIKKRFDVVDCRGADLRWFESPKYNLYLFGNVARDRPLGDCLFYIKDPKVQVTPIIIATHVNEHYIYSSNTLIIYPDNVLYHGSIRNNISSLPRAEGKGLLLSPQFQYQGEFKNGYPHGYGSYRSRSFQKRLALWRGNREDTKPTFHWVYQLKRTEAGIYHRQAKQENTIRKLTSRIDGKQTLSTIPSEIVIAEDQ